MKLKHQLNFLFYIFIKFVKNIPSRGIIYNKNTYQPDLIIKEHNRAVTCVIQLNSGELVSCSADNTIKLYNINGNTYNVLQTLSYHTNTINKIIELINNI